MSAFNLSLNSVVQSVWNLIRRFVLFECLQFSLELFVVSIIWGYHLGHGADDVGVESNSRDHPDACEYMLDGTVLADVTKANCGKSLQCPIVRNNVKSMFAVVLHAIGQDPTWVEVTEPGLQEPKAANQMIYKQGHDNYIGHLFGSVAEFEYFGHSSYSCSSSENAHYLKEFEQPNQSLNSWDTANSQKLGVSNTSRLVLRIQLFYHRIWHSCYNVDQKPAFEVSLGNDALISFINAVAGVDGREEIQDNVN